MNQKAVIITGSCGGIGTELTQAFGKAKYFVVATDSQPQNSLVYADAFLQIDLQRTWDDANYAEESFSHLRQVLAKKSLFCLINNAAVQITSPIEGISRNQMNETFSINVMAPFLWAQTFLEDLSKSSGSIINMGSVHARQTKSNFASYAMSKAAIDGLTRSMAVECGSRVRVLSIAPGAISTSMLEAGFSQNSIARQELDRLQPIGRIGTPAEVAKLAVFLASPEASYMNGAIISCDGGISVSLRDPG